MRRRLIWQRVSAAVFTLGFAWIFLLEKARYLNHYYLVFLLGGLLACVPANGAFALTPVTNYLFASLGFLCLFGWAAANGMFHDIERPKRTMLENEQRLDKESHYSTHNGFYKIPGKQNP